MDVAAQIGLEGDEFDSALDYAADQGWFEDAEVGDSACWCGRCKILILPPVPLKMKCEYAAVAAGSGGFRSGAIRLRL
jgi:hypothetical protein